MTHTELDKEYYVMMVDGAKNHPLLAWGSTRKGPFLKSQLIDVNTLELPLKIVFAEPYPKEYEMADFLLLTAQYAGSSKLKDLFEQLNIYGVQFVPVEIKDNKGQIINGHYVIHFWNRIPAIDKNNYDGEAPNMFGNILKLNEFSLDENILKDIPLDQRLIFALAENTNKIMVHKNLYEQLISQKITGCKFFPVDEWDDNAMFR